MNMHRLLPLALAAALLAGCATRPASVAPFAKGADVGWLSEMEAARRHFYDASGKERDLFAILKDYGMDSVRLRVRVDPADGYNGVADTIAKARRAKAAGIATATTTPSSAGISTA